jgi:hypothetical protein
MWCGHHARAFVHPGTAIGGARNAAGARRRDLLAQDLARTIAS